MNTNKTKNLWYAIVAVALMVGGAALTVATVNNTWSSAFTGLTLALLSVLLYTGGAILLSRFFGNDGFKHGINHGLTFALIVIAAGALLLGFNTGFLNPLWKSYFISWWMLLLVVGACNLWSGNIIFGLICAGVAKFSLIENAAAIYPFDSTFEQFSKTYWPAMIIFFGIILLLFIFLKPWRKKQQSSCCNKSKWNNKYSVEELGNNDGKINYRFVCSGSEQVILDPVFRGGNIEVICGGMQLDLRRTALPEGDTFLYIKAVIGGVEISAPDEWDIDFRQTGYAGGMSDSRVKIKDVDRSRRLIIVGDCKMGGVTVK